MAILQKFGHHLKGLRFSKKMTQEDLAEQSGLSRQYIGDVERGTRNISLVNLEKLATAFKITLSELFKLK
ncbi:MAG: helix-turn-helix transcriptional regulator [Phycisphaerae bacterium]|nr:helix-turn-helix transcriptional regulator [Phycisphaerae bacterium]